MTLGKSRNTSSGAELGCNRANSSGFGGTEISVGRHAPRSQRLQSRDRYDLELVGTRPPDFGNQTAERRPVVRKQRCTCTFWKATFKGRQRTLPYRPLCCRWAHAGDGGSPGSPWEPRGRELSPWGLGGLTSPGGPPQALVYAGERRLRLHLNRWSWGRPPPFGGGAGPSVPSRGGRRGARSFSC